jgi:hypothetical protein
MARGDEAKAGDGRDNDVEATEGDVMAKHIDNNHDDQVSVEEGAVLTKMVVQMEVMVGDLIVVHRGGDAIHATVDDEAEFTKKVGTTEGLHTMEGFRMTNLDRVDHATIDEVYSEHLFQ